MNASRAVVRVRWRADSNGCIFFHDQAERLGLCISQPCIAAAWHCKPRSRYLIT